jgi:hypothetical protein
VELAQTLRKRVAALHLISLELEPKNHSERKKKCKAGKQKYLE